MDARGSVDRAVPDQCLHRLGEHLNLIAAQDWDYFASLRYRLEGKQAVSDLWRLAKYIERLEADRA